MHLAHHLGQVLGNACLPQQREPVEGLHKRAGGVAGEAQPAGNSMDHLGVALTAGHDLTHGAVVSLLEVAEDR